MNVARFVAMCMLLGLSSSRVQSQAPTLTFGSPLVRDIGPAELHEYPVQAGVGDLVSGTFALRGVAGTLAVLDPAGVTIKTFELSEPQPSQERLVGFLAPAAGTFRIRIQESGATRGSYTLRVDRAAASTRMRDVQARPRDVYPSERIKRLARDIQQGQPEALKRFWQEAARESPFFERLENSEEDVLATFLWRETYDIENVLLLWPPTTQGRADEYYLSHLAGTDVWYKTIRVRRGSRFTYAFSPNDGRRIGYSHPDRPAESSTLSRGTRPLDCEREIHSGIARRAG